MRMEHLEVFLSRELSSTVPEAAFEAGFWNLQNGSPYLAWETSLPPPDNHCHSSTRGGSRYPVKAYTAWLQHVAPHLKELLGDWKPDTERWWQVQVELWLGSTGDGQNYLKPILDALTGAYVVETPFMDEKGRRIGKGTILKPGGLWDDDNRVTGSWRARATRHPTPYARVTARTMATPLDFRAQQEAQEREQRQDARQKAVQARQQALAADREQKAQERREWEARRTLTYTAGSWDWWLSVYTGKELASARKRVREALKGMMSIGNLESLSVTFTPGEWAKLHPQEGDAR